MQIDYHDPHKIPDQAINDHPADRLVEAYCPRCGHEVDAVCPECGGHVETGEPTTPGDTDRSLQSTLPRAEFYRLFVGLLQEHRNAKFFYGCYLFATGDAYADGVSMVDFAREHGVTKATVSKHARRICNRLRLTPSKYMRDEKTARQFARSNRRNRNYAA